MARTGGFDKMRLGFFLIIIATATAARLRICSYKSIYLEQQQLEVDELQTQQQPEVTTRAQIEQQPEEQYNEHSPMPHHKTDTNHQDGDLARHHFSPPTQNQTKHLAEPRHSLSPVTKSVIPPKPPKNGQPLPQAQPPLYTEAQQPFITGAQSPFHTEAQPTSPSNSRPIWRNTPKVDDTTANWPNDTDLIAAVFSADSVLAAANHYNKFSAELFQAIVGNSSESQRNIIYSPISLQLLLAFVYTGASGQTALEMQRALSLPASAVETQKLFYNFLQTIANEAGMHLVMANKMYHSNRLTLQPEMQQRARYFDSEIEAANFDSPRAAAAAINAWVAQKTQNIIRQLVSAEQLDAQTQAMLVNAIHFKARWAREFSTVDTEQQKFYVTPQRTVNVQMMYNDDNYRYGEFPELDACGLEMFYANTSMSMLLLLPNSLDGLAAMEQRLQGVDLNGLSARMQSEPVVLRMPKFTVDFELDMRESLKKLGINQLFTDRAELNGFFRSGSAAVSQMQHKAFLDVNEAGSEAAAASFIKLIPLSLPSRIFHFSVDHPFMFAIRSPQAVLFIGHVVNI